MKKAKSKQTRIRTHLKASYWHCISKEKMQNLTAFLRKKIFLSLSDVKMNEDLPELFNKEENI